MFEKIAEQLEQDVVIRYQEKIAALAEKIAAPISMDPNDPDNRGQNYINRLQALRNRTRQTFQDIGDSQPPVMQAPAQPQPQPQPQPKPKAKTQASKKTVQKKQPVNKAAPRSSTLQEPAPQINMQRAEMNMPEIMPADTQMQPPPNPNYTTPEFVQQYLDRAFPSTAPGVSPFAQGASMANARGNRLFSGEQQEPRIADNIDYNSPRIQNESAPSRSTAENARADISTGWNNMKDSVSGLSDLWSTVLNNANTPTTMAEMSDLIDNVNNYTGSYLNNIRNSAGSIAGGIGNYLGNMANGASTPAQQPRTNDNTDYNTPRDNGSDNYNAPRQQEPSQKEPEEAKPPVVAQNYDDLKGLIG